MTARMILTVVFTVTALAASYSSRFYKLQPHYEEALTETAQFGMRQVRKHPEIDFFMANWQDRKGTKVGGSLTVWDILTKLEGDPLEPKKKGAVLVDLNRIAYAELKALGSTRPKTFRKYQQIWYIISGEGVIDADRESSELYAGIGVIVPPDVEFIVTNTGDKPLTYYIIEEPIPDGFRPRKSIVVKYEYDNDISTNIRRVENENLLFSREDGLAVLFSFNPVMYEPKSWVPPHVHDPGIEEVWIGIDGDMSIQVGSQRRIFPPGSAYKVPANGITPHTNINGSDVSKKLLWMMKVPLPPGYDSRMKRDGMI